MHSDLKLKASTQVAYLSFLAKVSDNLIADGKEGPFSMRELIKESFDSDSAIEAAIEAGKDPKTMSLQELSQYSDLSDFDKSIIERFPNEVLNWKIKDIHDARDKNGMYACLIETSDKSAIVAFRGSENMKKYKNLINDWIKADFGLLNSAQTNQQAEAEAYADYLLENGLLDQYDKIAVTGHSLGGNLASHFTIACAGGKRKEIFDKIDQCVNFDGPGFSNVYLDHHASLLEEASKKITHYKWSPVGDLLFNVPGEKVEYLAIDEKQHKDSLIDRLKYKTFGKHDTKSLLFDRNGKAKRGEQDIFSKAMGTFSRAVDTVLPQFLTTELYAVSVKLFKHMIYEKENGDVGFKLPFVSKEFAEHPIGTVAKTCNMFLNTAMNLMERGAKKLLGNTELLYPKEPLEAGLEFA